MKKGLEDGLTANAPTLSLSGQLMAVSILALTKALALDGPSRVGLLPLTLSEWIDPAGLSGPGSGGASSVDCISTDANVVRSWKHDY